MFNEGHKQLSQTGYEWGIATARYFAGEVVRDIAERDPSRRHEAIEYLHESLMLYWEQGDFWGAGGAMSGLACVLAQRNEHVQAATYFGAASDLMQRVGASLLPTELMTHDETAAGLRIRMGESLYDAAFQNGAGDPELFVNQAIKAFVQDRSSRDPASIRLTQSQLAVVRDLAGNLDPPAVSRKRGRKLSSTYEMLRRICERLGVERWEEIAPFAIQHGIVVPPEPKPAQQLGNWVVFPENP